MPVRLSVWKKIESFLFPVSIRKGSSALNPVLELFYYQGRYLLATPDAVYSDGKKYRPLLKAFHSRALKAHLAQIKNVLVLGTGLASAVHILHSKNYYPQVTLVEIDKTVLEWAQEFLPDAARANVKAVHADAFSFVAGDVERFDLIIVDIFFGRVVPERVTSPEFIAQCKARLNAGGSLVLNYMQRPNEKPGKAKAALQAAFHSVSEISFGINKVYVAF